jgi:hypothetical protein
MWMLDDIRSAVLGRKDALLTHYKDRIREGAIERAKVRIVLHGKSVSDYAEDDLEVIVKEEEDKLKEELKTKSFAAILAILGLGSL